MAEASITAKKILGESGDNQFRTDVKKVYISGIGDLDVKHANATVVWDLVMEGRSWGVKDVDVAIESVVISATTEDVESQAESEFNASYSTGNNNGWKVSVQHQNEPRFPLTLLPVEVTVHLQNKLIEVQF